MADIKRRKLPVVAVIADMVGSRELSASQRPLVQVRFQRFIDDLNRTFVDAIVSKFVITLGDEFQGLLWRASVIPDVLWDIEEKFSDRELRVGFGFGVIHTAMPEQAINVDGPALHDARSAITIAKKERSLGGVFEGFNDLDDVLNGLARLLWFHRSRLTTAQMDTLRILRRKRRQIEVAEELKIPRQQVHKRVVAAGLREYVEAEDAMRKLLKKYVDPPLGARNAGNNYEH